MLTPDTVERKVPLPTLQPASSGNPYGAVFRRELTDQLRQPQAWWLLAVAALCFALAFWQGGARVTAQIDAVASAEQANWSGWRAQSDLSPHAAAHYPMLIAKPPAPLGALAEGAEQAFGGHVFTDAHRVVPVSGSMAGDRPLERVIGALDASFVVGVMLSLIAVLAGCDLVAGEKARGTLRLTFANALGRRRWFLSKLSARILAFWGIVALGAALAWAVTGGVPVGTGWAWRLGGLAALSGLYVAAWVLVGAACSVAAPRPASAALAAIACWIVLVAVAPRALVALAEAADPAPATAPSRMALQVEEVRIGRAQMAMVEAATRRGELKGASSITAAEGGAAIREAIDERAARARAKEEAPLTAWRASQLQRLSALAYASPAALYFQAASGIAGTDDRRHGAFVEQAGEYRHAFLERLNALEDRGVKTFEGYDAMPRFAFSEAGPTDVARAVAGPLVALLAFAAALAALSLGLMRRADLR